LGRDTLFYRVNPDKIHPTGDGKAGLDSLWRGPDTERDNGDGIGRTLEAGLQTRQGAWDSGLGRDTLFYRADPDKFVPDLNRPFAWNGTGPTGTGLDWDGTRRFRCPSGSDTSWPPGVRSPPVMGIRFHIREKQIPGTRSWAAGAG